MKFIHSLLVTFIISQVFTHAVANERYSWMDTEMAQLKTKMGCIEVPTLPGMNKNTNILDLDNTGRWVATGIRVEEGKLLQMEWLTKGVLPRPSRYRVLYRIDPRFSMPQIFIQKFDFTSKRYISDFHQFKNGELLKYQNIPEMTFPQRIKDYNDYFNFNGRDKIPVKIGDVVNITIDNSGNFFGSDSEMNNELFGIGYELLSIYTATPLPNNQIFYNGAAELCSSGYIDPTLGPLLPHPLYVINCQTVTDKYWDVVFDWGTYIGQMNNPLISASEWQNMPICPDSANDMDNDPICKYNLGRGMIFTVGGTEIKSETQKFIHSPFTGKDFFYYKSTTEGALEFVSPWGIEGMYNSPDQLMSSWGSLTNVNDYYSFYNYMTLLKPALSMNFIYMGRYLMEIEIGNSVKVVDAADLEALQVEYYISDTQIPNDSTSGISIEQEFRGNASTTGFLWLRVINPNPLVTGNIQVKTENYTGTTWFSQTLYNYVVKPIRDKFNELSEAIYRKLISNAALQNIARLLLTLYVIIYGLVFLAGAVQITVTDIVTRVLKIAVVLVLFSETSWTFFSRNLFDVFINGTEYLMTTVIGISSSAGNIFGFVDPVIEKYINGNMWALLFIQLFQIHNGMTFFAIMTIYGILIFFRAVLQVVIGYCLAFVGLAVMISLAPFFIVLMLFEQTKGMFEQWIATMVSQMIQPTILLIFLLLVDQFMVEVVTRTVVRACWDILIPLKISVDLHHMSIPISFVLELPFLDGIPFYVPEVKSVGAMTEFFLESGTFYMLATSSFLFFAMCKLADGLMDYVSLVVQYLTNVLAARRDGELQNGLNPIKDITNDMYKVASFTASPITGAIKGVAGFAKEKFIDQKMSRRATSDYGGDIDYGSIKRSKDNDTSILDAKQSGGGNEGAKDSGLVSKNEESKIIGGKDAPNKLKSVEDIKNSKSKDDSGRSDKISSGNSEKDKDKANEGRKVPTDNLSDAQRQANKGSDVNEKIKAQQEANVRDKGKLSSTTPKDTSGGEGVERDVPKSTYDGEGDKRDTPKDISGGGKVQNDIKKDTFEGESDERDSQKSILRRDTIKDAPKEREDNLNKSREKDNSEKKNK